jgi:carboxylesterase
MRPLGQFLGDKGLSVTGVRLPGHGTTWEDLNARTAREWVATVDEALDDMLTRHDQVFVVGLSFGVALALDAAARRPDDIAGLVSLAGFIDTRDPKRFAAPLVRYLVKSLPGVGNDICDPDSRELCYDRLPTSAAYAMLRFCSGVKSSLDRVEVPLLVIHSHNDHTAHPGNAEMIYERTSSTDKEIVWVDRSYHVITLDHDREEVYRRTFEFIDQRAGARARGV